MTPKFLIIWPDNFHAPTTIDLLTLEELDTTVGGFDPREIEKVSDAAGLGNPIKIQHDMGATVILIRVDDRITITENLVNGAQLKTD